MKICLLFAFVAPIAAIFKYIDRVFSVGMLEHVGRAFYPAYYEAVASLLKPDGLMLVHTIGTMRPMKRMDAFMLKHIFPNTHIPSQQELADAACAAGAQSARAPS